MKTQKITNVCTELNNQSANKKTIKRKYTVGHKNVTL